MRNVLSVAHNYKHGSNPIKEFKAKTQWDDFTGLPAADLDGTQLDQMLQDDVTDGETIPGLRLFCGEAGLISKGEAERTALVATHSTEQAIANGSGRASVRRVGEHLPLTDAFKVFTQFSVSLSRGGCLNGRELEFVEAEQVVEQNLSVKTKKTAGGERDPAAKVQRGITRNTRDAQRTGAPGEDHPRPSNNLNMP